jgi:hypothetical protein
VATEAQTMSVHNLLASASILQLSQGWLYSTGQCNNYNYNIWKKACQWHEK